MVHITTKQASAPIGQDAAAVVSPTPWSVRDDECLKIQDAHGDMIGMISQTHLRGRREPGEAAANAAFIVKACNAHVALVKALEQIAAGTRDDVFPFRAMGRDQMAEIARAALSSLKGNGP